MGSSQAIANYERLSTLTGQMREAAAQAEWDQLVSIERQCAELVAAMKSLDTATKLDEEAHQRKNQLIAKILADDAEIRNCIQVCLDQLQRNIQSNRQEQLLLQTYGV